MALAPEPFILDIVDGAPRFPEGYEPPERTAIFPDEVFFRGWVITEAPIVKILIEDKMMIYRRIGYGLHGEWICDRQWDGEK